MDNYIVRVLRRKQMNQDRAVHLDGVVEAVDEGGARQAFHSVEELWSILAGTDRVMQTKSDSVFKK